MTNKEKANQLVKLTHSYEDGLAYIHTDRVLYENLMEMAEWKDARAKACFILISKLIRDGLLTKDNPEHIMVEQMIELYNNLKI